jgi:hypothetical protein
MAAPATSEDLRRNDRREKRVCSSAGEEDVSFIV